VIDCRGRSLCALHCAPYERTPNGEDEGPEQRYDRQPRLRADREFEKLGYDIESRVTGTGRLRFIEVKGRVSGANTVTITKSEILYSLNKPDDFMLAIVEFLDDGAHSVHCVQFISRWSSARGGANGVVLHR
jgi:hypothetical protein